MKRTFLFSLLLLLLGATAEAATWHVKAAVTCPNNGDGTSQSCAASAGAAGAWNTPVSAFQSASVTCGDTVQFYTGTWVTNNDGTNSVIDGGFTITTNTSTCAGNPILYKAANNQTPELRNCPLGSTSWAQCARPTLNLGDKSHIVIDGFKIVGVLWNSPATPSGYNGTINTLRKGIVIRNNEITVGWALAGNGDWAGVQISWTDSPWLINNYVHDITPDGLTGSGAQAAVSCFKFHASYQYLTEFNTCRNVSTANPVGGSLAGGFDDRQDANNGVLRYNWCQNVDTCIRVQNSAPLLFTCASGGQAYGNIMIARASSTKPGIKIDASPVCDYTFYNNTVVNFHTCLNVTPTPGNEQVDGVQWYNNICSGILNRNVLSFATTTADIDKEDYNAYSSAADYQTSTGTQTSLTSYLAAIPARNIHSGEVNCLFISSTNFHLQGGSPCKAGQSSTGRVGGEVGGSTVDRGAYFQGKTCVGVGCVPPNQFKLIRDDAVAPIVTITSPTSGTSYDNGTSSSLTISGTAVDDLGVTACTWRNSTTPTNGTATGTSSWTASSVSLIVGTNNVVITCRDAFGNTGSDTLAVTRQTTSSGGIDRPVSSCAQFDTQYNAASNGDRLIIAGITCNFDIKTLSKCISLVGVGAAGGWATVFNYSDNGDGDFSSPGPAIYYSYGCTNFFEVTGISWTRSIGACGDACQAFDGLLKLEGPGGAKNFRVHHNRFTGQTRDALIITRSTAISGLIDHNEFNGSMLGVKAYGRGDTDWTDPFSFGTQDDEFLYVEDNTFTVPDALACNAFGTFPYGANDLHTGGRIVFRNNTAINAFFQTHDRALSDQPSGQAWEVYNNSFVSHANPATCGLLDRGIRILGGTGLVFGNSVTGWWWGGIDFYNQASFYSNSPGNQAGYRLDFCNGDGSYPRDQNTPGQAGYRCEYQPGSFGFGPSAVTMPIYVWGNTCDSSVQTCYSPPTLQGTVFNASTAQYVQANREYYNASTVQTSLGVPFNGTSGMGFGPDAFRPTTCTPGVAYVSTDQGEWDSTHAGFDGVMRVCLSPNVWGLRWGAANTSNTTGMPTPHPHPLQSGGAAVASSSFPGAVGFSASSRHAYEGSATPQICRVTNLNDSGDGSLREALSGAGGGTSETDCNGNPRIVICETSGTVVLSSRILISNPYLYWAGQTCPNPGMTVRGNYIEINTHHVLFRHVRIRPGVFNGVDLDGITIFTEASNETSNIFIDHASLTWATDENFGMSSGVGSPDNIDLQHSIIAEAFVDSVACETVEACANVLVYPDRTNVSLIGNLIATSKTRCPNIYSGASVYAANNVIYNCENTFLIADHPNSSSPTLVTAIGNVFKRPVCFGGSCYGIYSSNAESGSQLYHTDTVLTGGSWSGVFLNAAGTSPIVGSPPITLTGYTPIAGSATLANVLANAGAYPAFRDSVDMRILNDAANNTGTFIDDVSDVGGFPTLAVVTINHSGGSHPRPASPHADSNGNGYTDIEDWLQSYACVAEGGAGCWATQVLAFPGCEGFGCATRHAYDGSASPEIRYVTNLNDSGAGSLRAALEDPDPGIVVCEVSGWIDLLSDIQIDTPYIFFAGETCPSPGLGIRDFSVWINGGGAADAHDVVVRHLIVAPADTQPSVGGIIVVDAQDVVVDHNSMFWYEDEGFSAFGLSASNITFSNNFITEGIDNGLIDSKGSGGLTATGATGTSSHGNIAVIRNLIAHNARRSCTWGFSRAEVFFLNNVCYNGSESGLRSYYGNSGHGAAGSHQVVATVGDVFIKGPNTPSSVNAIAWDDTDGSCGTPCLATAKIYNDNILTVGTGFTTFQNLGAFNPLVYPTFPTELDGIISDVAVRSSSVTEAYVLANSGARPASRNTHDARMVTDVQNRTGSIKTRTTYGEGSPGTYPTLTNNTIDHDSGAHPLPASPHTVTGTGYTEIEVWIQRYACEAEGGVNCWN